MNTLVYDHAIHGNLVKGSDLVLTIGTFDLLHEGHLKLFQRMRRIAGHYGRVLVGVNRHEQCVRMGKRPVQSYDTRSSVVNALRLVDHVSPYNPVDAIDSRAQMERILLLRDAPALKTWFNRFIVVGSDWANRDYYGLMGITDSWLDQNNIVVLYTQYTPGISTTMLKENIHEREQRQDRRPDANEGRS